MGEGVVGRELEDGPPASAPEVSVRLRGVTKRFGDLVAVRDVDLDLYRRRARLAACVLPPCRTALQCLHPPFSRGPRAEGSARRTGAQWRAQSGAAMRVRRAYRC